MALTRQDVNEGKLRIPEVLGKAIARSAMQVARQVQAGAIHHDRVGVLTLDPLHERYYEVRRGYGPNAHIVLFFNDAAQMACGMYEVEANFTAQIQDHQLPDNLGVALQIEHYYVAAILVC